MLDFLIVCLAIWRITHILHSEKIAEPIRKLVGFDGLGYPDTIVGYLFSCFYCLSVWISGLCYILYLVAPVVLYIFAASAGAIIIHEGINRA